MKVELLRLYRQGILGRLSLSGTANQASRLHSIRSVTSTAINVSAQLTGRDLDGYYSYKLQDLISVAPNVTAGDARSFIRSSAQISTCACRSTSFAWYWPENTAIHWLASIEGRLRNEREIGETLQSMSEGPSSTKLRAFCVSWCDIDLGLP